MSASIELRTYRRTEAACFRKTAEQFGALSNMAPGFPIFVGATRILTSEALYQACRFPHLPDVQRLIIDQSSPMTAKMRSKPYRAQSRPDWDEVRVRIMKWCLRAKFLYNWRRFSQELLATGSLFIVEDSRKDDFWGAIPLDEEVLEGRNVLGRLLVDLREEIKLCQEPPVQLRPLSIGQFRLFGEEIGMLHLDVSSRERAASRGKAHGQLAL